MSMNTSEEFTARLERVQANKGRQIVMVGQDETIVRERKQTEQVSRQHEVAGNLVYPATLLGAFVLGMFAVALGHYARFVVTSGPREMPDATLEMLLAGSVGICIAFALAQMFRLTSKEHKAMQGAGVFLMVCTFHNLSHWAPAAMGAVFSADYVAAVTTDTGPNTFRFRGAEFVLFQTGDTAAASADSCGGAATQVRRIELGGGQSGSLGITRIPAPSSGCE